MLQNDFIAPGCVWLVGAGPGDPDLLTRKAERLIMAADIVFYDALVGQGVFDLIPARTERVSVGKRSGRHSKNQDTINDLLIAAAREEKRVVRLKGGDPSIFGRSAEEVAELTAAGVVVRICPGITAASAAAASGGTSLTLRGLARGLTFVTAHARAGEALDLDWQALSASAATLAIYMGRSAAGEVARSLIAAGKPPETPVMIAVNVSLPTERLIRGQLSALGFLVSAISDDDPTLLLIGAALDQLANTAVTEQLQQCAAPRDVWVPHGTHQPEPRDQNRCAHTEVPSRIAQATKLPEGTISPSVDVSFFQKPTLNPPIANVGKVSDIVIPSEWLLPRSSKS